MVIGIRTYLLISVEFLRDIITPGRGIEQISADYDTEITYRFKKPKKWRRYDHQDTAPSAGARHPLPRVRYCAFHTRRGIIYHRTTITLMISLMYKIENRWPPVIPQLLKVSVSDHTTGKHVNDRPDLLLSHTGIAHAFFIYLTLIYSSNMLHNDKEKYWELVEVLPAFRIRFNKL